MTERFEHSGINFCSLIGAPAGGYREQIPQVILQSFADLHPSAAAQSNQTASARKKEAERLWQLLNATHVFLWESDFSTRAFSFVSEQAVNVLGYPLEDWYKPDFWPAHLHREDRTRTLAEWIEYSNTRDNYELEFRMIAKDSRVVWLHTLATVIREDGEPKTILGFSIDITEGKQFEAVLKDLSSRLINAQEEERRRVARRASR